MGIWVHLDKQFDQFYETYQRRTRGDGHAIWMDCQHHPRLSRSARICINRDGFQRPITHAALEEDALYGLQLDGMSFEMLITMLEEYGHGPL